MIVAVVTGWGQLLSPVVGVNEYIDSEVKPRSHGSSAIRFSTLTHQDQRNVHITYTALEGT